MKFLYFLLITILPAVCLGQSESTLLAQAQKFETEWNDPAALEIYQRILKSNPRQYTALWKCSELCSRLGSRQPTAKDKENYYHTARNYALNAVKINPNGADGFYTLAVATGRIALLQSGRDKVRSVKEIRSHAEHAIRLNPAHARAWHVLGKWHYEVANLGMFEKAALRMMYGGLPAASFADAVKAYERARQLEPGFALNYLELAKAYHQNEQNDKAIELLK
jgi:tetratricopeptide (TPR) repeat protein